jgi:hypothetical protein
MNEDEDQITKDIKASTQAAMKQMYERMMVEMITSSNILLSLSPGIHALDTRPWWKKYPLRAYRATYWWIYHHTLGRFRAWLHRDCGDGYL